MKISIVTPNAGPSFQSSITGNEITAVRWKKIFNKLGHDVVLHDSYKNEPSDMLVALHARKSSDSIFRFGLAFPNRPIVLALTGTDIYEDGPCHPAVAKSISAAKHVVTLQPNALKLLDKDVQRKTTTIYQSAERGAEITAKSAEYFQVCLVAHLRPVKDPLRAAKASELLPVSSKIKILHVGEARDIEARKQASLYLNKEGRYLWLGPLSHGETRSLIANSHLLLLTSRSEGGANVLSEALALNTPIIATRINGVEGLLGAKYPGYFPAGETKALADLLVRIENDTKFYRKLQGACRKKARLVEPAREIQAWSDLLNSIA